MALNAQAAEGTSPTAQTGFDGTRAEASMGPTSILSTALQWVTGTYPTNQPSASVSAGPIHMHPIPLVNGVHGTDVSDFTVDEGAFPLPGATDWYCVQPQQHYQECPHPNVSSTTPAMEPTSILSANSTRISPSPVQLPARPSYAAMCRRSARATSPCKRGEGVSTDTEDGCEWVLVPSAPIDCSLHADDQR